jgi:hypothetical protein
MKGEREREKEKDERRERERKMIRERYLKGERGGGEIEK